MQDKIIIKGAREHNLQNVNLEIPRNKMIVFTGLSGSGKSSLAFDTIFAEGQRRYVESLSSYARQFLGQMDKPDVDEIEGLSPAISIDQKAHSRNPRSTVATITEIYDYLRVLYARIGVPHCPQCKKEIRKMTIEEMVDVTVKALSEHGGKSAKDSIAVLSPVVRDRKGEYYQMLYDFYNEGYGRARVDGAMKDLSERVVLAKNKRHTIELVVDAITIAYPLEGNKAFSSRLAEALELAVKHANGVVEIILPDGRELLMSSEFSCPDCAFAFPEIEPRLFSFNSPQGACTECSGLGTEFLFSENPCPACHGERLRPEALHVLIHKKNIAQITSLAIRDAVQFFEKLALPREKKTIAEAILREIQNRLSFMNNVGLDYLTLNRKAGTLSGGEAQRIRLASQIGSRLVGALYILDEPTIGLHQRDNARLIETLTNLRDLGNTVIVVEHDEDTIWASDYLVDLGPGAGKNGGKVVAAGPMPDVLEQSSLTTDYLRGKQKIDVPKKRRQNLKQFITIKGAAANNLKNITVKFPLKRFVAITGVSGSGKSTLTEDILYRSLSNALNYTKYAVGKHKEISGQDALDKIIDVDQSAIGRTPRSNPATYTGMFTHIRDIFAATADARERGYGIGRFSFNRPGGRCEHCEGNGFLKIEMHFLPDVFVPCTVCKGTRFDRETLQVKYKGKNVSDVLKMTVDEAYAFFENIPTLKDRLKLLKEVGLGYIELGQSATTLSGGEAQRIKLSTELAKRPTGRTMYILDEPTVGLHFEDVKKLIEVLQRLVDRGNSVVVIEHNLDVIKSADYVIDLGPEGGEKGGEVVVAGTPEEVARHAKSFTGQYLKKVLKK